MPPRKCQTKAPRAAKNTQVEEQPKSPCLPLHNQEEPTDPVDPPLTNEEEEADEGACARKRTIPSVITSFHEKEKELIIDFLQQNPIIYSKTLRPKTGSGWRRPQR
ncbi:hypothetical protein DPMN_175601 [Dreissena polymorpha]|uniref:Uncharacterized protein n=1 Tax=Dreissena polymorpha TaxID=45954 RepID=A0A9D4E6V2_DREPO|nr:hypothetical protein DPMN_175601 [Dreissena polymorpha]